MAKWASMSGGVGVFGEGGDCGQDAAGGAAAGEDVAEVDVGNAEPGGGGFLGPALPAESVPRGLDFRRSFRG